MAIPEGFSKIEDDSPSIPEGFSLIPEGFEPYEDENDPIIGAMETALSFGTGAVAMPLAGLGGLATGSADNVNKINEALTYQPRTKTGQEYLKNTSEFIDESVRQPLIRGMTPIQMEENKAELIGTIGADVLLNLAPLGAIGKAGHSVATGLAKAKTPTSPRLSKLDEIAQRKQVEVEAQKPAIHVDSQGIATEGLPARIEEIPEIVEYARQQALKRQEEVKGTVYVDSRGQASKDLGTVIKEDPQVTDTARTVQQNVLEDRARELGKDMGENRPLFDAPQEQLPIPKQPFRAPSGQRGAIDLDTVKHVTEQFKRGIASARDVLNSWKGAFSEMELAKAKHAIDRPDSRDTIALMSPDDFHRMAAPRHPEELTKTAPRLRDSIKEGLKSKGGLWEMPYLRIAPDGKVEAHEGRHRMDVFKEQGHSLVPVRLHKAGGKWGEGTPRYMLSQKNLGNGAPDSIQFPEIMTRTGVRLPESQRGAIKPKEIGDGLKKLAKDVSLPEPKIEANKIEAKMATPEKVVESLPGNKKALKDYIPVDPKPEDVINAALQESDSNLTMTDVQSGATMTGIKYNSSLITGIGRLYQNAQKRAEKAIRDKVYPVEHTIKDLPRNEIFELSQVMKREMFDGQQFTIADLQEAGFSSKQIDAYIQVRQMQKEALKAQNIALEKLGKKPITEREAYLSSRWNGDWHAAVVDEKGKLRWYIAETSKRKAENALKYLQKTGEFKNFTGKVEYRGDSLGKRGPLADAYRTMLNVIDPSDPRAQALKSVMEEGMANEAFNTLGQKQHFKTKANVRGFIGDRPWKSPESEAFELFKQQFEYTKNAYTWAENTAATTKSKEILADPRLVEKQPNNIAYAQKYAKNKLGFGENAAVASLEASMAKVLGQDRQMFNSVIGSMKSFFILSKLGFNTGFMLANYIQPLWTAPHHANLSSLGYKHHAFQTLVNAGMDGFGGFLRHQGKKAPMTDIGIEALKYAEDNGIVNRNMFDETAGLGKHAVMEVAEKTAGFTIQGIEHMARLNAFMGFIHHLDQSGAYPDKLMLFQKAEELTNAAMVDYRPGERPMMFDQAGMVGSAASALQTFKFSYYNQLHHFYKEAVAGRPRGLLAFMALQGTVGGMLSMPFLQEIDDAWEMFKSILPDSAYLHVKDFGIKKWMIDNMNDWAAFGGMSKITGANMTSRFDSGNLVDFSLDGLFPFITDLAKQVGAVAGAVTNLNQTTTAQAAYAVAPPGPLQGAVETGMDAFKGKTNEQGNTPYFNPRKLQDHDASYVRSPTQENYRKFGLTELEESKYREQRYRQGQQEKQMTERQAAQSVKFFDAMFRQDKKDMEKYVSRYVAYGGNPEVIFNRIDEEILKSQIPKETLDAAKASTLGAIQKTKRMKELLNGFNK